MGIKAVLDSLDGVDEAIAALYTEREDGKFELDAEDVDELSSQKNLKSAFEKQKREARQLREQAQKYDGVDPDKYRELIDAAEKRDEEAELKKGEFDKIRERMAAQHKSDLAKKEAEIEKRDGFIRRLTVDKELTAAIEKAGVRPEYRAAVRALMKEKGPTTVADGDDYRGVFKTDLGEQVAIGEYVETWAKGDDAAAYMPAQENGGSGAGGSGNRGGGGKPKSTFDRNDPLAWGQHAEAVAKGDASAA